MNTKHSPEAITAASEMLAALRGAVHHDDALRHQFKLPPSLRGQIEAAIAKAEGQQSPAARKLIAAAAEATEHFSEDELERHADRQRRTLELLAQVSRCAKMPAPCGIDSYAIAAEIMDEIRALVAQTGGAS